jgi:hypothetical protein
VRAAAGLRGKLDNVDMRGTGVGHISIDKNEAIQRRVIGEIDAAIARAGCSRCRTWCATLVAPRDAA